MKIGFIGLGIMGEAMCGNIVKKHNDSVYVSDLSKEKVALLEKQGAVACENNIEAAKNADVIITMVPKSKHSMAVYKEILPVLDETKLCIDMSTIDPAVSVEISEMVKKTVLHRLCKNLSIDMDAKEWSSWNEGLEIETDQKELAKRDIEENENSEDFIEVESEVVRN